jgi:hypothetical protein
MQWREGPRLWPLFPSPALATVIGVVAYWINLPAGGAFWGLADLQSGTTRNAYSASQPLPPEAETANSAVTDIGDDPRVTASESTASTAAPILPNPAAAPEADPNVILLSGEAPLGDATTNPGASVMSTGDASPSNGGAPAAIGLPALGGGGGGAGSPFTVGSGIQNGG